MRFERPLSIEILKGEALLAPVLDAMACALAASPVAGRSVTERKNSLRVLGRILLNVTHAGRIRSGLSRSSAMTSSRTLAAAPASSSSCVNGLSCRPVNSTIWRRLVSAMRSR